MKKYCYGISFTILEVVESNIPLEYDEIIKIAAEQKGIDINECNDIDVSNIFK